MSIIADFLDLVKAAGENVTKAQSTIDKYGFKKGKSLANTADSAILQFPVFISDRIDLPNASNIVTSLEGEFVSFVQVSMGLNALTSDADIAKYIRQFHQNTPGVKDFNAAGMLKVVESSMESLGTDEVYMEVEYATITESTRDVFHKASIRCLEEFKESLNTVILNELATSPTTASSKDGNNNQTSAIAGVSNSTVNVTLDAGKGSAASSKFKQQLFDSDVKKLNKMNPTLIQMQVHIISGDKHIPHEFIMGVKTVLRIVPTGDMEKEIVKAINRERKLFSFFKATTGETNFLKDFIFAMDNIKDDALAAAKNSWAESLRRRRKLSNLPFVNILPNSSIIISKSEVDYLKREHSITLDEQHIRTLMNHYLLLAFVVVDEISEVITFYFDSGSVQQYTFASLESTRKSSADHMQTLAAVIKARQN